MCLRRSTAPARMHAAHAHAAGSHDCMTFFIDLFASFREGTCPGLAQSRQCPHSKESIEQPGWLTWACEGCISVATVTFPRTSVARVSDVCLRFARAAGTLRAPCSHATWMPRTQRELLHSAHARQHFFLKKKTRASHVNVCTNVPGLLATHSFGSLELPSSAPVRARRHRLV